MARFRRARTAENKKQREQDILVAAGRVCDGQGLEAVTFETVAAELGVTRPLIYSYFHTRDDLLAAMLDRELAAWTADMVTAMEKLDGNDPDAAAAVWSSCVSAHPRLTELCAAREVTPKSGLSKESRQKLSEQMTACKHAVVAVLSRIFRGFDRNRAGTFYDMQLSLAVGMHSATGYFRSADETQQLYSRSTAAALRQFLAANPRPTV